MTMTSKDFAELRQLLARAGNARTTILTGMSGQQTMDRGPYLQALERHGPELVDLAYKGATGDLIVTALAALIPIEEMVEATQTGATLVEWYRKALAERADLTEIVRAFQQAKAWVASDSYDGIDDRGRELLELADSRANIAIGSL